MKNLHILPTDKPSRLTKNNLGKFIELNGLQHQEVNENQHIYITNDEEIKEGDWLIWNDKVYKDSKRSFTGVDYSQCKKIILTTDQSLDSVQKINDEFLQWVVKNPSCEEVEVKAKQHFEADKSKRKNPLNGVYYSYKIIIPKEEPNKTHYLDELPNMDREVLAKMWESAMPKLEPKQETLEEAAENNSKKGKYFEGIGGRYLGFIDGAKWQQEKMEEILRKAYFDRTDDIDVDGYWISDPEKDLEMLIKQFKKQQNG